MHIEVSNGTTTSIGTGFLFLNDSQSNTNLDNRYLVTNRHLVTPYDTGTITFIPGTPSKPVFGEPLYAIFTDWRTRWITHPDTNIDVAIMPWPRAIFLKSSSKNLPKDKDGNFVVANLPIGRALCMTQTNMQYLASSEQIMFIGYPADFYDKAHTLPIARHGFTASPIALDFMGQRSDRRASCRERV